MHIQNLSTAYFFISDPEFSLQSTWKKRPFGGNKKTRKAMVPIPFRYVKLIKAYISISFCLNSFSFLFFLT